MDRYYEIALGAVLALEVVTVTYYLRIMHPKASWKTLFTKLACSAFFVITAELASLLTANTTSYAATMLAGFAASFLGDFLLHMKPKLGHDLVNLGLGGVSFAAGHILFITAYIRASKFYFPDRPFLVRQEIIALAAALLVILFIFWLAKLRMGWKLIPVMVYAAALVLMSVKATSLGYRFMVEGFDGGVKAFIYLTAGSSLFTLSDIVLAMSFFGAGHIYLKKCLNISMYYAGQIFLALSLLTVK